MLTRRFKPLALFAALTVGCLSVDAGAQDLAASRAAWDAAGIADYEYSYQRVCECHPNQLADTIVTVRSGRVATVRYARDDYVQEVAVAAEKVGWYRTIDDLFSLVATAQAGASVVRVTFDAQLGYPTTIYIDYLTDLVGDEVDLKVTRFAALP
jgi:Family of unknown function (DUF6174)